LTRILRVLRGFFGLVPFQDVSKHLQREAFMAQQIGDEGIYLRLQQLQKGLLQFTDTTNAYRLLAEHGMERTSGTMPFGKNGLCGTVLIGALTTGI
jgi:hypothetical protein